MGKPKIYFFFWKVIILYILINIITLNIVNAYGAPNQCLPDPSCVINDKGKFCWSATLLSDNLWYPGYSETRTVTITNKHKAFYVNNIALNVELLRYWDKYKKDEVYNSFIRYMHITVKKKILWIFDVTLIDDKPFKDVLSNPKIMGCNGYPLKFIECFPIFKGQTVNLDYTFRMDKAAGNELQNMKARVDMLINLGDV